MPDDFSQELDAKIDRVVARVGWYALGVAARAGDTDPAPPFTYTIGLTQSCDHPEFIAFGVPPADAHALFGQLFEDIRGGLSYATPGVYTVHLGGDEHRVGFRRVDETQHTSYLGFAMAFCRRIGRVGQLQAMQAFWPDDDGRFPFEDGCDPAVCRLQPRLDVPRSPLAGASG